MNGKMKTVLSIILLVAVAFAFFCIASTNAPEIVFTKAANICLECIGVG